MKKQNLYVPLTFVFLLFQSLFCQTWSPPKRLTWNSGSSSNPAIAVDSSKNIHVVWNDNTNGNDEIYYKRSTDGGASWSAPIRLTWNSGQSGNPSIAADTGSNIHIAWVDFSPGNYETFYKRSTDSGVTWSAPIRLTWTHSGWSWDPSIAADTGTGVHVTWDDDGTSSDDAIFYKRSTDSGETWSAPMRLEWIFGPSIYPSIAANGVIHVAWNNLNLFTSCREVYYKRSTDGGVSWSSPKRLTWSSGNSRSTSVAIDTVNGVHIAWEDDTPGNYELYYKRSTDSGVTWSVLSRLTWNSDDSKNPSITASSSIHLVWNDYSPGNYEIFYKESTDGGVSWRVVKRLTWNSGFSVNPDIAVDSDDNIHLVWSDTSSGNSEIFYKNRK